MRIKVYRGIVTDSLNQENLGGSWSLDYSVADQRVGTLLEMGEGDDYFIISAMVDESQIDWEATIGQRYGEYPHEYEVVLKDYEEIHFVVESTSVEDFEDYEGEGDTGYNEYDETMMSYEDVADDEGVGTLEEEIAKFKDLAEEF